MSNPRPFLILFPGAWGNRTQELATWWMRHVIGHFKHDYQIVTVTYDGTSLDEYVEFALAQLKSVPNGSLALCYSMGAQIARGVAAQRPSLFRRVALFSGLERNGVRLSVLLTTLTFALIPMLRTLIGRPLMLDTVEQVKKVFFCQLNVRRLRKIGSLERAIRGRTLIAQTLLDQRLVPEPAWPMLRLFMPGLRKHMPPFPCHVMAVVPGEDFILPNATYPDEQVQMIVAAGDHALILNQTMSTGYFGRIATWFLLK